MLRANFNFFPWLSVFLFFLLSFYLPSFLQAQTVVPLTCSSETAGKSRADLELILAQCEVEILQQKSILATTKQQSTLLEKAIAELNYNIKTSQLEIKARSIKIADLQDDIKGKTTTIGQLSSKIEDVRNSIAKLIRETNVIENYSFLETILSGQSLSDFLADRDNFSVMNTQLRELAGQLSGLKTDNEEEKLTLEAKQSQEQSLKFAQEKQQRLAESYKLEKQRLLKFTKNQESTYTKEIAERERIKNEIRNRIFRTVGGQELRFEDALKLVFPYENLIGVDSALVLAVLSQESAVGGIIGKNLGKCFYNQTATNSNGTVMANSQKNSFLAIMTELGMDPNTTPVSCPIYKDGQYGGAMGPAQFMPSTWWNIATNSGYKNRIANVTGSSPASPFENRDAFVGTALYLKDAQSVCRTAFSRTTDLWACAAAKYYGGLALRGTTLSNYMYRTSGYGFQVAKRAQQFQKDIDLLMSGV